MTSLIYYKNQFFHEGVIPFSASDLGLIRGYGVHEFIRTYQRVSFHLKDHLKRLKRSAKLVDITLPQSIERIEEIIDQMIQSMPNSQLGIKIIVTGGPSVDYFCPNGAPELILIAFPLSSSPKEFYAHGIKMITKVHQRSFPEAKSTEYLPAILGLKEAKKLGAEGVLFCDFKGQLLEAGRENFFAFKQGRLLTPSRGILKGITRQIVLNLAKNICPIEERDMHVSEIPSFDSAFITSTQKEIMPVSQIDQHVLTSNSNYAFFQQLISQFDSYVKDYCNQTTLHCTN